MPLSEQYQVLKKYENQLIEVLTTVDLVSLAEKAAENDLVPYKIFTILETVHPGVPHPIKCRYLLYNMYRHKDFSGEDCSEVFDCWVKVLSEFRATAGVLSQMKMKLRCDASYDFVLTGSDVPYLTEALARCTHKWEEIATSLKLPNCAIKNIQKMMHMHSPGMCLNEVLGIWVTCKYPEAMPPFLGSLEKSLSSRLVGLGKESFKLRKSFMERCAANAQPVQKRFGIVSQAFNCFMVPEGLYTMLELQASTPSQDHLKFEWQGVSRIKGKSYSDSNVIENSYNGLSVSIFCLHVKDIAAEGTYSCTVTDFHQTLMSNSVFLSVKTSVDQYKSILSDFYAEQCEVPKDTWPPVGANTYISLALLKQEGRSFVGESGCFTIRGDVDDIYSSKTGIMYAKVFGNLESGTRLLVEGRPGSGKTTLVHKVSQDWANGKLEFNNNRLLFLVHLRAFSSDPKVGLYDILKCFYTVDSTIDTISKFAEKHNGLGLCFILDGLDEYTPIEGNPYIFRLIKKEVLPKSVVIVASRPAAAHKFRSEATNRVEVLGFLKNQILSYVEKYPFSEPSRFKKLHIYLDEHTNVHHMCYLPIHVGMVCFLFDNLETQLPQTETGIYIEFTRFTILRSLYRSDSGNQVLIESVNNLPPPLNDYYDNICKLAYETTASSKQVIQQAEVQSFFHIQEKDSFGLITIDRMAMRCGFQNMYTFLHLTFQEFLAASFISTLEEARQMDIIEKHGKDKAFQQVWKFYCGLAKFDEHCNKFKCLISKMDYGSLYKIQCCFESQQPHLCYTALENNSFEFTDAFLSPSNFLEIAYIISNLKQNPVLSLQKCIFDEEGVKVLVNKVGPSLTKLTYSKHDNKQLQILSQLLQSLQSFLEVLDLSSNSLDEDGAVTVSAGLKHCTRLRRLCIGSNNLLGVGTTAVTEAIECCTDLLELEMSHNQCGSIGGVAIGRVVTNFTNLRVLDLNCNGIGSDGAKAIGRGIKRCTSLIKLKISSNNIGNDGAMALAKGLKQCILMQELEISSNYIDGDATKAFSPLVVSWKDFHALDISNNYIGVSGFNDIFPALKQCTTLNFSSTLKRTGSNLFTASFAFCNKIQELDMSCNNIGSRGVNNFAEALKYCSSLEKLDISANLLGYFDIKVITVSLGKHCSNLHALDISKNSVSQSNFTNMIVAILKNCRCLFELNISELIDQCSYCKGDLKFTFLRDYNHLTMLDISNNRLGTNSIRNLLVALKYNTNLHSLHIENMCAQEVSAECSLPFCFVYT